MTGSRQVRQTGSEGIAGSRLGRYFLPGVNQCSKGIMTTASSTEIRRQAAELFGSREDARDLAQQPCPRTRTASAG